ncbi:hypothetical protein QVD17_20320 [Tagetes erecta]|uniref:Uncharacterized protein n=1 Tax=Tagetes erecta TaxID=13708 RepID=A0AAD8KLG9_TARER|nr:hypothetical protein QVD17_20320 [Tagetes erecta]
MEHNYMDYCGGCHYDYCDFHEEVWCEICGGPHHTPDCYHFQGFPTDCYEEPSQQFEKYASPPSQTELRPLLYELLQQGINMFSQPTNGCNQDKFEQQEPYFKELAENHHRIEALSIECNKIYVQLLGESSSCNTDLIVDLEQKNGSEAQLTPSFDVLQQELEPETIMDETKVPPPVQSEINFNEPHLHSPGVLTNNEQEDNVEHQSTLQLGKCSTTRSTNYEYDTHIPLFASRTFHDPLYPLYISHLSCEDDMMQESQRNEQWEDGFLDEMEVVLPSPIIGETTNHIVPSWEDEFGDELVSIPLMEGIGGWFDPIGDLDEIEALLYGKPIVVINEEPQQEYVQADEFTNEPITKVAPDPQNRTKDSRPVTEDYNDFSHESNKSWERAQYFTDQQTLKARHLSLKHFKSITSCKDDHLLHYISCIKFGPGKYKSWWHDPFHCGCVIIGFVTN